MSDSTADDQLAFLHALLALSSRIDLGEQLKHVDHIFDRVFQAVQARV